MLHMGRAGFLGGTYVVCDVSDRMYGPIFWGSNHICKVALVYLHVDLIN